MCCCAAVAAAVAAAALVFSVVALRIGLTEDSVHKRDAKLFEKLQLKLTKVHTSA